MIEFCEVYQLTKKKKNLQIFLTEIIIKNQQDTEKCFEDKKVYKNKEKGKVTGPK